MALAGGVTLFLTQRRYYLMEQAANSGTNRDRSIIREQQALIFLF
jgi:hypothetical protein